MGWGGVCRAKYAQETDKHLTANKRRQPGLYVNVLLSCKRDWLAQRKIFSRCLRHASQPAMTRWSEKYEKILLPSPTLDFPFPGHWVANQTVYFSFARDEEHIVAWSSAGFCCWPAAVHRLCCLDPSDSPRYSDCYCALQLSTCAGIFLQTIQRPALQVQGKKKQHPHGYPDITVFQRYQVPD